MNKKKIKVAFIYKQSNKFLTGKHFDNTYYHFFMNALRRNVRIEITYFPAEDSFDTSILKDKFDIVLLFGNNTLGTPDDLIGIQDLNIPVISRAGEPHTARRYRMIDYHKKYKIDYYFNYLHESHFYEYYPRNFKYKCIIFGLEPSLYQNLTPYDNRIKNRILNSGETGKTDIIYRIRNWIVSRESRAYRHYKLRTLCNKLPYVDYTSRHSHGYVNDRYPLLLSKYATAIAATTTYPTIKYWEIPAAGCLTFMEITKQNKAEYLGFVDGETSIFINEQNYNEKFNEYLSDMENPKWKKIAEAGRNYALNELNNDKATESLADLMNELI